MTVYKKKRKPRGIKKNGFRSRDMCSCGSLGCDFVVHLRTIYGRKKDYRLQNKLCIGCGKKECQCKSKK